MKSLLTIAFLIITTIANAQPGHHRDNGRNHKKTNKAYKNHSKHKKNDYKKGRKYNHRDYDYRVQREMDRYAFLNLSRDQKSRLQISLNFLITNNYNQREYERKLRSDLHKILNRNQYRSLENRAYNSGNTFIFNFSS